MFEIRNDMRNLDTIVVPHSKFRINILEILKIPGYINNYYVDKR